MYLPIVASGVPGNIWVSGVLQVLCAAHSDGQTIYLSPLLSTDDISVETPMASGKIFMSLCRPLNKINGKRCPLGAAVCLQTANGTLLVSVLLWLSSFDMFSLYDQQPHVPSRCICVQNSWLSSRPAFKLEFNIWNCSFVCHSSSIYTLLWCCASTIIIT